MIAARQAAGFPNSEEYLANEVRLIAAGAAAYQDDGCKAGLRCVPVREGERILRRWEVSDDNSEKAALRLIGETYNPDYGAMTLVEQHGTYAPRTWFDFESDVIEGVAEECW